MAESNGFAGRSAEWQEGYQFGISTFEVHIRGDFTKLQAENARLRDDLAKAVQIGWGLARDYEGYLPDPERLNFTSGDVRTRLMNIEDERKKLRALEKTIPGADWRDSEYV